MSKVKLPGLPSVNFGDVALNRWAQAVTERLEVREGSRGDPLERVVTVRALTEGGAGVSSTRYIPKPGEFVVDLGGGKQAGIDVSRFAEAIRGTKLYSDLTARIKLATAMREGVYDNYVCLALALGYMSAETALLDWTKFESDLDKMIELRHEQQGQQRAAAAEGAAPMRF